jgi:hypothetical protein
MMAGMTQGPPPWVIALGRAALGGLVLGGSSYFGQLASGASQKTALISAGVAFFGYLVLRGGAEGIIDQRAAGTP